jgi:hypothetical protein
MTAESIIPLTELERDALAEVSQMQHTPINNPARYRL